MKIAIDDGRQKFLAKQIADLGKASLTVGLASYFFERFPIFIRVAITMIAVVFLIGSFFLYPETRGDKK